jgi:hypothetical protein
MELDCPYLDLTPHWAYDGHLRNIIVVRGMDGVRLCRNWGLGFDKVPSWHAIKELRRASRSLEREISDFLVETSIGSFGGRSRSLRQMVNEISEYLTHGSYVGLRRVGLSLAESDPALEERRLVREIERDTHGWLWVAGFKYKLVAGADVDGIQGRANFEVTGHDDAGQVLEKLAEQFAGKRDLRKRLLEARTKLSPNWRPPMRPTGLVLLRRIGARPVASQATTQALSPSQLQALREKAESPSAFQFKWDQPFSQRQWVNLPRQWGVVAFGEVATLTGHVEPRAAGQAVTFTLLPDPSNPPEASGAALETTTALSDAEGKVQVEMLFPKYPGAKFKVAGKTASMATPVESEPITVWRKVYYQITEMAPAPDGRRFSPPPNMIGALESAFNPVWIELAPGTKSTGTTPHKAHLTAAERRSLEKSLKPSSVDNRSPFKMNIVMVDSADIVATGEWNAMRAGPEVETPPFPKWPHEATVISAEYRPPFGGGQWAPLTNLQVVDLQRGLAKIVATIPVPFPLPAQVRIRYRYQFGNGGGWGGADGTVFICIGLMRRFGQNPDATFLQPTLTHEIGHALALVPTTAPWLDPDVRDKDYSLRHCGNKTTAGQPSCVMWWEGGGAGVRTHFCSGNSPNDCKTFLLRSDLSTIRWI